jgi:membrane associated rhomboid family serine protease
MASPGSRLVLWRGTFGKCIRNSHDGLTFTGNQRIKKSSDLRTMSGTGYIGLVIIAINLLVSYKGFKDHVFFDRFKFEVDKILVHKQWYRLFTSGFLHVSWLHLIFNMISLYAFSDYLELGFGSLPFLIIYFASMMGGDLLALFIHRHHADYSSVGASGAVCGIIFATIALFPGMGLRLFFLPINIPSWLYGIIYIAFAIYGIRSKRDNIGHEAHLGGALVGMLVAITLNPTVVVTNYIPILAVLVPGILFIILIIKKPRILMIDNFYFKTHKKNYTIDDRYNEEKVNRQKELDQILDKINQKGIDSLTAKEKQKLKEYSKK